MKCADFHVHSTLSYDGQSSIYQMCQKAIDLGIEEIGFSEHMDFEPTDVGYGYFNYEHYTRQIQHAQSRYGDQLIIRKGIEIDYQSCFEDDIKQWLCGKYFDYVIGSVHYLNHCLIDHKLLSTTPIEDVYQSYFAEVHHSIDCHLFDVIGHLGLVQRYISPTQAGLHHKDYHNGLNSILHEIVGQKLYLELNLKGVRQVTAETIPWKNTITQFFNMGGRYLSIGSDAHSVHELSVEVKNLQVWLHESTGYNFVLLFHETSA